MPSRTEGFGLTALEALSAGLPVLVSRNSGIGKALKKVPYGSNCVVNSEFNNKDPMRWAEAIKAVCQKGKESPTGGGYFASSKLCRDIPVGRAMQHTCKKDAWNDQRSVLCMLIKLLNFKY